MSWISLKKISFIIIIILILTSMTSIINSLFIDNEKEYKYTIDGDSGNINIQRNSNNENKNRISYYSEIGKFRSKSQYSFNYEEYMGGKPLFSPLDEINDIVANQEYVWFATNGGLVEYNKKKNDWNIFDTSNGILGERVNSLALHNSNLWIGTFGGLSKYSILKNEITPIYVNGSYEQNIINSIAVDNYNLWVGHWNTVSKYNFNNKTWDIYNLEIQYPFDYRNSRSWGPGSVNDIYIDNNDVWVISSYGGIQKYSLLSNKWINFSKTEEITSKSFYSITGNNDTIWFGGYGIAKYSKDENSWNYLNSSHGLQYDYVDDIKIDDNFLWIITYNGISKYEITTGSIINYNESNGFTDYEINTIEVDNQYVWVGFDDGVYRYESLSDSWTLFRTYNKLNSYYINSILIDDKEVWFGTDYCISRFTESTNEIISYYSLGYTDKNGFHYYSNSSDNTTWYTIYPSYGHNEIYSICAVNDSIFFCVSSGFMQYTISSDSWSLLENLNPIYQQAYTITLDGDIIWLGLNDNICSYNLNTNEVKNYFYTYSPDEWIEQIAIDGNDVWFATSNGLWRYSKSLDELFEYQEFEWITSVAIDDDSVWIGHSESYIKKYSKSSQEWSDLQLGFESELEGTYSSVNTIIVEDEVIWFGAEYGLVQYNKSNEQIKIYNETNGLIPSYIRTMALDGNILWIGTENGVKKFNVKTEKLESFYDNKIIINETNGDKQDSFPNDPAASLDSDGDKFPDKWEEGKNKSDSTTGLYIDAFPNDPTQWLDSDGDNYGDNPNGTNPDAFPNDPTQWLDSDGDNNGDNPNGTNPDAFPNDPTQWLDSDGDNYGDNPNGTNPDYYPNNPENWEKEDEPPDQKKPNDKQGDDFSWLIVSAAIVIIFLFFLLIKRKKKEKVEANPPSPPNLT